MRCHNVIRWAMVPHIIQFAKLWSHLTDPGYSVITCPTYREKSQTGNTTKQKNRELTALNSENYYIIIGQESTKSCHVKHVTKLIWTQTMIIFEVFMSKLNQTVYVDHVAKTTISQKREEESHLTSSFPALNARQCWMRREKLKMHERTRKISLKRAMLFIPNPMRSHWK